MSALLIDKTHWMLLVYNPSSEENLRRSIYCYILNCSLINYTLMSEKQLTINKCYVYVSFYVHINRVNFKNIITKKALHEDVKMNKNAL